MCKELTFTNVFQVDREKLEQMLQIVNCVEVFVELSARRLGGNPLKWLIVLLVTIVKTSIRICLMFKHNRVLIGSFTGDDTPRGRVGARSGVYFTQSHPNTNTPHPVPEKELIVAELCYTLRPLLHLATLALFRSKSWVPLIVSAGLEAYSIKSLARLKHPTERQCNEMSRRKVSMLLYLLRSPFYNELTEQRLLPVVDYISKIPVLGLLTDGLAGYIPDWQKIYFYSWTSWLTLWTDLLLQVLLILRDIRYRFGITKCRWHAWCPMLHGQWVIIRQGKAVSCELWR